MANKMGQFSGRCPECSATVWMHLVKHEPRPVEKVWKGTCEGGHAVKLTASTGKGEVNDQSEGVD